MLTRLIPPPPSLRNLVKTFWTIEREADEVLPEVYWGAADIHAEWVFQLKGGLEAYQSLPHYILTPHSLPRHLNVCRDLQLFGVRFFPEAFQELVSIPLDEHINKVYHGCDLFQKDADNVWEQVVSCNTTQERVQLVTTYLEKRTRNHQPSLFHSSIEKLVRSTNLSPVSITWQQSGLSLRQFERRFKQATGFSPKYHQRIARFCLARTLFTKGTVKKLSHLALDGSYYDQSHFIREFKEFSGVVPMSYFRLLKDAGESNESRAFRDLLLAK